MINLKPYAINGKVSVKALLDARQEYKAQEWELAQAMYPLRGMFPRSDEYLELRNKMAVVKAMLLNIKNCLKIYARYGSINGMEVDNDCGFVPPGDWKQAKYVFD